MTYFKVCPRRTKRGARRGRRGFSIVEALVAAAVLGIALIGLVKLHTATMRGMKSSKDLTTAAELAAQQAEELATRPQDSLPNCPTGADLGCKSGQATLATAYSAVKTCTLWTALGQMRDSSGNVTAASTNDEAVAAANGYTYRVDSVITAHPTFPDTTLIRVSTCWRDEVGYIREVQTTRIVPNGI